MKPSPRSYGLLAPGARAMANLRFGAKALLISAIFLIPTLILGYSYVSSALNQIAVAKQERLGAQALHGVVGAGVVQAQGEFVHHLQTSLGHVVLSWTCGTIAAILLFIWGFCRFPV